MAHRLRLLTLALFAFAPALFAQTNGDPLARLHTDLGDIDVALLQSLAPNTVVNFLHYATKATGSYNNTFIHRSIPGFVIQGGGYTFVNNQVSAIPTDAPVANEFHASNKRGTLAMAKLGNDPNSATDQWFFNLVDNGGSPNNLDTSNGGYTVFARIINPAGLTTMDAIAAVPVYNAGTSFPNLPLLNYVSGNVQDSNLVHVIWINQIPQISALTHPSANTVHVQGVGSATLTYQLQTSASPAAAAFTTLTSVTADSNGNISYSDTSAGTKKFYRLVIP